MVVHLTVDENPDGSKFKSRKIVEISLVKDMQLGSLLYTQKGLECSEKVCRKIILHRIFSNVFFTLIGLIFFRNKKKNDFLYQANTFHYKIIY